MTSSRRTTALAVLLVVLGVGATLGGLYGQIFLAEDEGHHDGRDFSFATASQVGADELVVSSTNDNEVTAQVLRAGQTIGVEEVHDGTVHYFVANNDLSFFEHTVADTAEQVTLSAPAGDVRVIAQLVPSSGTDFLELGASVSVAGEAIESPDITDTDEWTNGDVTVDRQLFDFVLSDTWNGGDVRGGPAYLSLIRADDMSYVHSHAELVNGNRFSFGVNLPGLGDYLASVEFEQDGEPVTALFRFSL